MFTLRSFLILLVLIGVCTAIPYFRLSKNWDPTDLEDETGNSASQFLPYIKRNIAIGRGDGLRPGK